MATVTTYVDPDADGANNGGAGNDAYQALETWNTSEATDLTTDGDVHECWCVASSGGADSTKVEMGGWTGDVDNFCTITGDNTSGVRNMSAYHLAMDDEWDAAFQVNGCDYIVLEDLQFNNDSANQGYCYDILNCDYFSLIGCIAYDGGSHGFYDNGTDYGRMNNCTAVGCGGSGYRKHNGTAQASMATYVANCTNIGCGDHGFEIEDWRYVDFKNDYAGGCVNADYVKGGNSGWTFVTCYSEDGTGTTTQAAYSTAAGCYFTNVGAGTEDPEINAGSALANNGTDVSGDGDWVDGSVDIEDTARDANWDVGCYELVAAGGTIVPQTTAYYNRIRSVSGD